MIEIRGAQDFLEPPLEVLDLLVANARRLANQLNETSPIPKQDVLEKIASLARIGKEIWDRASQETSERDDPALWKQIVEELDKLNKDLDAEIQRQKDGGGGRPPQAAPEILKNQMLDAIEELRQQVSNNELEGQFGDTLDQVKSAIQNVNLRDKEMARNELVQIIDEQLKPLYHQIDRTIKGLKEKEGESPDPREGKTTVE